MIGIINYRAGNLQNLKNSLDYIKVESKIIDSPEDMEGMTKFILPGVGAFGHAAKNLRIHGFWEPLLKAVEEGIPLLGICVGMQLLFSKSYEDGEHEGLGLIKGEVRRFETELKVPQMGWNTVAQKENPLLEGITDESWFYFVHSFACHPDNTELQSGVTTYDEEFCSIVNDKNVWGVQFHPEKSQDTGLKLLKNFVTNC
ncbi:MAG: glutamine amidotransferase [bacterium]|jgi:glutamine amidotransferase